MTTRIAVLASGGGSNLQAILDHQERLGSLRQGAVVLAISNRAEAPALERARAHGIPTEALADPSDGDALCALLESRGVELVVLAGYLKLVPPVVVRRFAGRVINVHPALLPSFGGAGMYGRRVHEAVLASGVRVSGPTVHLVDEEYDRGLILAQWPVPVLAGDDADRLAARVLRAEHQLLPRVVEFLASRLSGAEDVPGRTRQLPDASFTFLEQGAPDAPCMDTFLAASLSRPATRA